MASKKGFWTLTKVVKIVYTQYEDDDYCDETLTLKKAKVVADSYVNDYCEMTVLPIEGEDWEVQDYDEDDC